MLALVGPGLVVAATGVGAGDMVAAVKAGAAYGLPVLWVAALGAVLKYSLALFAYLAAVELVRAVSTTG